LVESIQQEVRNVIYSHDMLERLKTLGYDPDGSSPGEFDAKFKTDVTKFAKIIVDVQILKQD
jgi:tripartite-type tricarboxylate transporter receptor subunit TctC